MSVATASPALQQALEVIRLLADDIGPRRPCSETEKRAADLLTVWLQDRGVEAHTEEFAGYSTFAKPYAVLFGASLAGGLLQRSASRALRRAGTALAGGSAIAGALEGDLRRTPLSDALSTEPSVNVIGRVPAAGPARRRVCLVGHLDTSRSGALFHPAVVPHLAKLLQIPAISTLLLTAGPLVRRLPAAARSTPPPSVEWSSHSRYWRSVSCAARTFPAPATTRPAPPSPCSSPPSAPRRRSSTPRSTC